MPSARNPKDTPPDVRTLTDAKALAALANDSRSRIMDALKVDGPSTASGVAQRVGLAVGSASHHLKVLHEARLVTEAPELAKDRRERWWRLANQGTRWSAADLIEDPVAQGAGRQAAALQLSRQADKARRWMVESETVPEWEEAAFATQNWLRVTPDELSEVAEEIISVLHRWGTREVPDDGAEREPVLVFARGFPSQP